MRNIAHDITASHALRLCVKARQADGPDLALVRDHMREPRARLSDERLRCLVDGQTATLPTLGHYALPGDRVLVPLHDESFVLASVSAHDGTHVCTGFRLLVGYESLAAVGALC